MIPAASGRKGWDAIAGMAADVFLICLICTGIFLRFHGHDWDEGASLHPDEYGLANTLSQLSIPKSAGQYFNTRISPLSPYAKYDPAGRVQTPGPDERMRWGQWPITLIRWAAEKAGRTEYRNLIHVGRRLSALADSLSLFFLFLIGRCLYGRRIAMLATALSALAVMQIQQSHFMTVDTFAVLFTTMAVYCAVRVAQSPQEGPADARTSRANGSPARRRGRIWKWYVWFGVATGMAVASRINLLPLAGMVLVGCAVAWMRTRQHPCPPTAMTTARVVLGVTLAALVALATFRVTHPMAFRAESGETAVWTLRFNPDWVESMKVAAAESNLDAGGPPAEQWTGRRRLLFPLVNMVFWGMGLPLGLAACVGAFLAAWRSFHGDEWRIHLLPLTWMGGYFLLMGTRRVMAMRYFLPIYPFLALLAAWILAELWRHHTVAGRGRNPEGESSGLRPSWRPVAGIAAALVVVLGTLLWSWGFTGIYRKPNTRVEASRWLYAHLAAPFNLGMETEHGPYSEPIAMDGTAIPAGRTRCMPFRTRLRSTVRSFSLGPGRNLQSSAETRLRVVLSEDPEGKSPLAEAIVMPDGSLSGTGPVPFGPAVLKPDRTCYLCVSTLQGGPFGVAGAAVANETWDESLPVRLEGRDPFGGLYRGLSMEVRWPDNESKRKMLLDVLGEADYVILPSQRALWSISRLPDSYPLTMEYYRALFDGRLGFELAAQFHRPIQIGPLQVSDLTGKAAWRRAPAVPAWAEEPFNNSFLAAEEAFSVYDHAPVWIFRKRPDFNPAEAQAVLHSVDLGAVVHQTPRQATLAPTALMLPPARLIEQRLGGTWSTMCDPGAPLNRHPLLAALAWYGTLCLLGWMVVPLACLALGSLPDRGYPLTKTLALVFLAWSTWMAGSLRLLPFTRFTVVLAVLALAAASMTIVVRRRAEISAYLRRNRAYILTVEVLSLSLFALDLVIRFCNPDLWHPFYGGEKPMVFSYLNAVLKSSSFPPYDPWLAGGYINYYYFGFVVAGQLVQLLGIQPSIAYNLILPAWFALLGSGAFCIAFNLARAWNQSTRRHGLPDCDADPRLAEEWVYTQKAAAASDQKGRTRATGANPYFAGMASVALVLLLGNLGQVKVIAAALERASGRLLQSASGLDWPAVVSGATRVLTGASGMPISLGNWYWDATRIVADATRGNEINEFPLFSFLYGDMHAHMLDMPIIMLVLAWALAYLLAKPGGRPFGEILSFWLVGGLALGATRVTNMWDFPGCLALCGAAVVAAWSCGTHRITQAVIAKATGHLLILLGLPFLLYWPFDQWFASPLAGLALWSGAKTPLEPYLLSHGLCLFILLTQLFVSTVRWLKETPASVVSDAGKWLLPCGLGAAAFVICAGALAYLGVSAALVALPAIAWSGLLLLRCRIGQGERSVIFLLNMALLLTLFVEICAVGGDRINTLFKVYLQVWLILGVAAGPALAWMWHQKAHWTKGWRGAWTAGLCLLTAGSALYPATAVTAKIRDRFPIVAGADQGIFAADCRPVPGLPVPNPHAGGLAAGEQPRGLDGMAYMQWSAYCSNGYFLPLRYDYEAIRWMQAHVAGSPVIAEAQSFDLYGMSSRYAWNTGLPDVVGWDWHQRQQRAASATQFITERGREVNRFYADPGGEQALKFMRRYQVQYIVLGPLERACYQSSGGLGKFDSLAEQGILDLVYRNPGILIYRVADLNRPVPAAR